MFNLQKKDFFIKFTSHSPKNTNNTINKNKLNEINLEIIFVAVVKLTRGTLILLI